jgi:stage II sporulation protein P
MVLARRAWRTRQKNGPGLLFILIALVVVAAAGAKYLGLYAPEQPTLTPQRLATDIGMPVSTGQQAGTEYQEPVTVLVFHSHTSENYSPRSSHEKNGKGEILQVGAEFCQAISEKGIKAIHLKGTYDTPAYSEAFRRAGEAVAKTLAENPNIQAVIDLHRDGLPKNKDKDYTTAIVAGQRVGKILFVVGDVANPNQNSNMAFGEAAKARLEAMYGGVSRGIRVQHRNVNGNLHPNTLVSYLGDYHGNSLAEAKASARILADVVTAVLLEQAREGMLVLPTTTP